MNVSIVIPTVGRPSLGVLLEALARGVDDRVEILIVDDRGPVDRAEPLVVPATLSAYTKVLAGGGAGPAAARNVGWQAARSEWIAFLDDDVVPDPDWFARLARDLDVPPDVGGVQGRVRVPLPAHRRPTDWERSTAGLARARWITADMAYRSAALTAVGGFDERFPRAYREDTELAHRVRQAGWRLLVGARAVSHPVRPEGPWASLRAQRGNADDALLRRMYGPRWRALLEIAPGRRRRHVATTAALVAALIAPRTPVGMLGAAGWLAGTAEFALARVGPGPRTPREIVTMAVTSAAIPPLATMHWLRGWWAGRGARPFGEVR
ncbi:glycosyltransferase family 2 protein [Micromonospora sp. CPCC 206061]|uniref:glycosyltransferase family 2 protein n=1 Tax=Micromonospora sp. CPCC 206061 TaxID=3122410 RepID=UPI002FF21C3B